LPTFYTSAAAAATDTIVARYHSTADKYRVIGYARGY
jgi:hypothetical protein